MIKWRLSDEPVNQDKDSNIKILMIKVPDYMDSSIR